LDMRVEFNLFNDAFQNFSKHRMSVAEKLGAVVVEGALGQTIVPGKV